MIACDDNGNHAVLVEHDNSDSYALAVDWIHGLLFWADFELNNLRKINVMDLNTKQRKVLFKNLVRPEFIAVDPSKGLIFWSDRGRIERASMDGNDRMTIANSSSSFRIALDIFNERVYLIYSKTIASVDYNGNDWRTILLSDTHIKQPMSLAMFEEKLYWADFDQHGVFVMNKFNGTEIRKSTGQSVQSTGQGVQSTGQGVHSTGQGVHSTGHSVHSTSWCPIDWECHFI
uniref:Uncharacterized protein n=1 Tax=Acrobeloides nanus TaxID=290746 RepID=A0A914EJG5_9BILA